MNRLLIWLVQIQIKNGWLPIDWFYASARLFGEACLELCILRLNPASGWEVYLLKRDKDDPFYPSMYHIPGTRKISGDTEAKQIQRTIKETPFSIAAHNIKYSHAATTNAPRGTEFADVRYVVVPFNQKQSGFFSIRELPRNMISFHRNFITEAVKNAGL